MKNKLKDFFNYSSSERKGSIALVALLLIALSGYWLVDVIQSSSEVGYDNLSEEINSLTSAANSNNQEVKEIQYFEFNPNEIDEESWVLLGFSEKQAQSIIKYREKGGYFYKKEDLKRLYVVDDSLYDLLEPYVVLERKSKSYSNYSIDKCYFVKLTEDSIPIYDGFSELEKIICNKKNGIYSYYLGGFSSVERAKEVQLQAIPLGFNMTEVKLLSCDFGFVINKNKTDNKYKKNKFGKDNSASLKSELNNFKVKINAADTTGFKSLKGIGSYYSSKIVKYRKALGGFVSVEQLKEVYGILPEVIDQNVSRLIVDSMDIVKVNINTCETADLKRHPYISWNIANSIVQIRRSQEPYKTVEEIKKSDLVNDEIYRKIAPYLKTE
ncbi:helix-hairpin-helix domain-containing protein [Flavobacteriales bacterium]|nr:helix-hairpin-helix domain-containing protein [Flavobacteriales bacterium]